MANLMSTVLMTDAVKRHYERRILERIENGDGYNPQFRSEPALKCEYCGRWVLLYNVCQGCGAPAPESETLDPLPTRYWSSSG